MSKSKKKKANSKHKKVKKKIRPDVVRHLLLDTSSPPVGLLKKSNDVMEVDTYIYPYEEDLLERSRELWQKADWQSLCEIDLDVLEHHPDRAKLALLTAAGHIQLGNNSAARQCICLAREWGCSKKLMSQVLISGVYNSLGRAALINGQESRAFEHIHHSITLGTPGKDTRLLTQTRITQQIVQLDPPFTKRQIASENDQSKEGAQSDLSQSLPAEESDSAIIISVSLPDGRQTQIPFNANVSTYVRREGECLHFDVPEAKALYLCSNHNGDFSAPPQSNQFSLLPNATYLVYGQIECPEHDPIIWTIEYDEEQRISHATAKVQDRGFGIVLCTHKRHVNLCLAIRLSGQGTLDAKQCNFHIRSQSYEDTLIQRHLEKTLNQSILNATRQLEAFVSMQNFLTTGERMPDMHVWPISPDLAMYLIDLLESSNYDIIIEFGSGTSTILMARTLTKLVSGRVDRSPVRLISFEHSELYYTKTNEQLQKIGKLAGVNLVLAPLETYIAPNGISYPFYRCHDILSEVANNQPVKDTNILVFVDGPPESTGKHARYPALPLVLNHFKGAKIDILLDDYIREDEKEIVRFWKKELEEQGLRHTLVEKKFEKEACLITIF